jgi:NAD-dependent deacetylase
MGYQKCVITQNVDGLHVMANSQYVIEYHGSLHKLRCPSCGSRFSSDEFDINKLREEGKLPPYCSKCGRPLKDDVVHFNEPIPGDVVENSIAETEKCDLMLICGTSAVVYPFAQLPRLARERRITGQKGKTSRVTIIEVNADPTPLTSEGISDYLIQGSTSDILPRIVQQLTAL